MDKPFLEAVLEGGMVADGAMGNSLYERGVFVNRNFDEVCLNQPELVYQIHREISGWRSNLETNSYGGIEFDSPRAALAIRSRLSTKGCRVALERPTAPYVCSSIGPTGLSPSRLRQLKTGFSTAMLSRPALADAGCHA